MEEDDKLRKKVLVGRFGRCPGGFSTVGSRRPFGWGCGSPLWWVDSFLPEVVLLWLWMVGVSTFGRDMVLGYFFEY